MKSEDVALSSWKYVSGKNGGKGHVVASVPTEFGLARLTIAGCVPEAFAPLITSAPKMAAILRAMTEGKFTCREKPPCKCLSCQAIRIIKAIDSGETL